MACCLTAPSHYLNQCWLIISEVLWHSPKGNFKGNAQNINPWYEFLVDSNSNSLLYQQPPTWHSVYFFVLHLTNTGNNTNIRHSDMADKMSPKSEKLPNLPDKMLEECYGTKIVISHHQLLFFCLNKTIQTTFHYGQKWRLLTVMACLITNAVEISSHSCHYSSVMSIKMLTLNLLTKCGTKQLRTFFI